MNKIVVNIANQEYTITGKEEKDYILSLASHVDEQIRIAQEKAPKINSLTPVILASINITDQLFKERKKLDDMRNSFNPEEIEPHCIDNSDLIEEQNETIENLYERIQKLDNLLVEKNQEISNLNKKNEQYQNDNKELNILLNQFQNDIHELEIQLNKKSTR